MHRLRSWIRANPWYTAIVFLLLLSGTAVGWLLWSGSPLPLKPEPWVKIEVRQAPSPLTGFTVPLEEARRYPVAVIIENTPDARPQSGLAKAGLVYEAYAEGGITRYLALFVEGDVAGAVGPVRSIRTYFLDWASELRAILGHVGGNIDALDMIGSSPVYDLDEFAHSSLYWRDPARYAPHNAYTTLEKLRSGATGRGDAIAHPSYPTFIYKDSLPLESRPQSGELTIAYGGYYSVRWVYERSTNSYHRELAGSAHLDAGSGEQITASNVIVQIVPQTSTTTRIGEMGLRLETAGGGRAVIYEDGTLIEASWRKGPDGRTRYFNSEGVQVGLNRGKTWIEVIPPHVSFG